MHQQYLLASLVELVVTAMVVAPVEPPSCEPQNATPCIDTPPHVADQFDCPYPPLPLEHVVDDDSFTHLVTADAGGQSAIIAPNKNTPFEKCIIVSPVAGPLCIDAIRWIGLNANGRLFSVFAWYHFSQFFAVQSTIKYAECKRPFIFGIFICKKIHNSPYVMGLFI